MSLLRVTPPLLASRGSGYHNRVMVYAHRRQRAFYLSPKKAHKQDPTMNKPVEEYGNTWDPRSGIEWYYRMRQRNHYRHWPWARWTDDPVRFHEDFTHRRTFSALAGSTNEGMPEWNYYEEVGQEYNTPSHFPLAYVAPFIHQYTGKLWSPEQLEAFLETIATCTGLRTIEDAAKNPSVLRAFGGNQHAVQQQLKVTSANKAPLPTASGTVPLGLLAHVELVTKDIVDQNARRAYRQEQQCGGVLRTREMVRYYALPYMRRGPAMPQLLAQPSGEYPWGKYTYIKEPVDFHPLQRPDGRFGHNMYPV